MDEPAAAEAGAASGEAGEPLLAVPGVDEAMGAAIDDRAVEAEPRPATEAAEAGPAVPVEADLSAAAATTDEVPPAEAAADAKKPRRRRRTRKPTAAEAGEPLAAAAEVVEVASVPTGPGEMAGPPDGSGPAEVVREAPPAPVETAAAIENVPPQPLPEPAVAAAAATGHGDRGEPASQPAEAAEPTREPEPAREMALAEEGDGERPVRQGWWSRWVR